MISDEQVGMLTYYEEYKVNRISRGKVIEEKITFKEAKEIICKMILGGSKGRFDFVGKSEGLLLLLATVLICYQGSER